MPRELFPDNPGEFDEAEWAREVRKSEEFEWKLASICLALQLIFGFGYGVANEDIVAVWGSIHSFVRTSPIPTWSAMSETLGQALIARTTAWVMLDRH